MSSSSSPGDDGMIDALLVEVAGLLEGLLAQGEDGAIDLLGLPLSPFCVAAFEQRLGRGEIGVRIDACELSEIHETDYPGVWWTQHADQSGRVIARLIEVAFVPNILRAHPADIERGRQRLLAPRSRARSAA
jgi:hydrogenase-1 operon protein HyaF